jgi:hypothetical protein
MAMRVIIKDVGDSEELHLVQENEGVSAREFVIEIQGYVPTPVVKSVLDELLVILNTSAFQEK